MLIKLTGRDSRPLAKSPERVCLAPLTIGSRLGIAALASGHSFTKEIFTSSIFSQRLLPCEPLDLELSTAVYLVVELTPQTILCVLAILAHHDHRRLDGGQHGEEQV